MGMYTGLKRGKRSNIAIIGFANEGKSRLHERENIESLDSKKYLEELICEFCEDEEFYEYQKEFIRKSMEVIPDSEVKTLSSRKLKKLINEAKRHGRNYNEINDLQKAYIEALKRERG